MITLRVDTSELRDITCHELTLVAGYMLVSRWFTCAQTITRPSINRARRRATTLIKTTALPLSQGQATTAERKECSKIIRYLTLTARWQDCGFF